MTSVTCRVALTKATSPLVVVRHPVVKPSTYLEGKCVLWRMFVPATSRVRAPKTLDLGATIGVHWFLGPK